MQVKFKIKTNKSKKKSKFIEVLAPIDKKMCYGLF